MRSVLGTPLATSLGHRETSDQALIDAVRGHWSAIENGTHHVRDASLGEDRSRIAQPTAARAIATFRNLAIGIYNLDQARTGAKASSLPSWQAHDIESDPFHPLSTPARTTNKGTPTADSITPPNTPASFKRGRSAQPATRHPRSGTLPLD